MIIVRIFRLCASIAARRDVAAYRLYAGQIHIAPVRQPTLAAIKSVLKSARGIRWELQLTGEGGAARPRYSCRVCPQRRAEVTDGAADRSRA
jgi:hypothetical protein